MNTGLKMDKKKITHVFSLLEFMLSQALKQMSSNTRNCSKILLQCNHAAYLMITDRNQSDPGSCWQFDMQDMIYNKIENNPF